MKKKKSVKRVAKLQRKVIRKNRKQVVRTVKKLKESPEKAKLLEKPTIEAFLQMADTFYDKFGKQTQFYSKESYMLYIKDYFTKVIEPMSKEQYEMFVVTTQKQTIDRLTALEKNISSRLQNTSGSQEQ